MLLSAAANKVNELITKMDGMMSESTEILNQVDSENFAKALENMSKAGLFGNPAPAAELNDSVTETVVPDNTAVDNVIQLKPKDGLML